MSLSDVSSLTDLSSDDDDYKPVSRKKNGRAKKEWQPKQVLKAPRLTQYSTTTLYEEVMNGKVDLDPEYQRAVVWPDAKQSGLIDSILRNFYIPPVIFGMATPSDDQFQSVPNNTALLRKAFSQNEDGEERRTCIDGKQRLTSIQRFMDGQIPFKDSRTNLKLWYKRQPWNDGGKLLPPQYKKQFDMKQIGCVEYTDLDDDAEREIFQRVQLGVALTPAERMQAIAGPWPSLVREVLAELDKYNISDALEWSKKRGRDFHSVAVTIYLMEKGRTATYPAVTSLEKWLRRVTPPTREFKDRVTDVFAIYRQLVLTKKHFVVFRKPTRVSPIEFVMIAVLIDNHYRNNTLTQLTDGIRRMRKDVRETHDDIRANTKVTKTILTFVRDRWPTNLKKEPGEKKALEECKAHPVPVPAREAKRKRVDDPGSGASSSDDEVPLKSKVKPKAKTSPTVSPKTTTQRSISASTTLREPPKLPTPKPEPVVKVKSETVSPSESRSSAPPDRLDKVRKAKERIGLSSAVPTQAPTPPPTTSMGHVPLPQHPSQNFMGNPNQVPAGMWPPSQYNPIVAQLMNYQQQQQNLQQMGQGPMVPPSSNPNMISPTDGRPNPFFSGPPTPNLHAANGQWILPNDPNNQNNTAPANYAQQRSVSMPSVPGVVGSLQFRDSRFDGPGVGSSSNSRRSSPLQSFSEPQGRRQGSGVVNGR